MRERKSRPARDDGRDAERRRRIAVEAARLISEQGLRDYGVAKRKAAERLGLVAADTALPKNSDIEEALREYQRLFDAQDQPQRLRHLREVAREALQFFAPFEPRLVGAVLDGSADRHSAVCLHVFSDDVESVLGFLEERSIPVEQQDRPLRLSRDTTREFPALLFKAGTTAIDLTVLPTDLLRHAPLDRNGDKPMRRGTLAMLDNLLADAGPEESVSAD